MAELPEAETIVRQIEGALTGAQIEEAVVLDPLVIKYPTPEEFRQRMRHQTVSGAERRAKYIMIHFESQLLLAIQLQLYGQLILTDQSVSVPADARVLWDLADHRQLRLLDEKGYSRVLAVEPAEVEDVLRLSTLGPEPLAPSFMEEEFRRRIGNRRTRIKPLLLDQHFISGVGNIYADEALWRAGIHPEREARSLTAEEIAKLYQAVREVLREGIANRGTSFHAYVDLFGQEGQNQHNLKCFLQRGKPCPRDHTPIKRMMLSGRQTYYCPTCQVPAGRATVEERVAGR